MVNIMKTLVNKSVNEIVNSITAPNTGSLRRGDWTTKLAECINNGDVVVNIESDHVNYVFREETYPVSISTLAVKALQSGAEGQLTYAELLDMLNAGFISPRQKSSYEIMQATGIKELKTNPLERPERVLTATEYKENCIRLALDAGSYAKIAELVKSAHNITDKTTKTELHSLLVSFADVFFNYDQQTTYAVMLETEEAEQRKFQVLLDAGMQKVERTKLGNLTSTVSFAALASVMPALTTAGYKLVNSVNNMENLTVTLVFTEGEQPAVI